jgi:hypothetical protein
MNEPKDPVAAETVQTTNDQAVDPAAICSPARVDVFGWFGDAAQTEPEHDPGPDAPCPICGHSVGRHSLDNPIKTISLMVEDPAKRRNSFFFRAHKRCWEMVSDHERSMVESSLIDHIVDADKMVAPEHHFRDAAQMVPRFLPCPFCGSDQIEVIYDDGFEVGCKDCSTYVAPFLGEEADNKQKHIDFWNTRAPIPLANDQREGRADNAASNPIKSHE